MGQRPEVRMRRVHFPLAEVSSHEVRVTTHRVAEIGEHDALIGELRPARSERAARPEHGAVARQLGERGAAPLLLRAGGRRAWPRARPPARRGGRAASRARRRRTGGDGAASRAEAARRPGASVSSVIGLADRAFHLELDEAVHLDRVLHRQLLDDRLDEAVHDHGARLCLRQAAAHQVEELLGPDLGDGGLVPDGDVLLVDLHVRVRVRARLVVQDQRVTADRRLRLGATGVDLDQAAIAGASGALRDGLGGDQAGGVRRGVDHLAAGVLVLIVAREGDREHLAVGALAQQVDGRVLHGQVRAKVAVHPLHHRVLVGDGALGDEVVDVVAPVLDGRVANPRALLDDDLDHRAVQAGGAVGGRRAALHVVQAGALVGDDQGPLELAHVLRVDPEVGLQRQLDMDALGHVDEGSAGPDRRVQRRELVVVRRNDGAEVLPEDLRVLLQPLVGPHEDDALRLELGADVVVHDLRVVLAAHPGEVLLLGLGDAQPVVGAPDVVGHVVPVLQRLAGAGDVVVDVLEVDPAHVAAPGGQRARLEMAVGLEPQLGHPLRLILDPADLRHDVGVQALLEDGQGLFAVVPAVLVAVGDLLQGLVRNRHRPSIRTFAEVLGNPDWIGRFCPLMIPQAARGQPAAGGEGTMRPTSRPTVRRSQPAVARARAAPRAAARSRSSARRPAAICE